MSITTTTLEDQVAGLTVVVAYQDDAIRRLTETCNATGEDLRIAIRRLGESRLEVNREQERAQDLASKLAEASVTIDDQAKTLGARELALRAVFREHAAMAQEIAQMRAVLIAGATGVFVLTPPPGGWRN